MRNLAFFVCCDSVRDGSVCGSGHAIPFADHSFPLAVIVRWRREICIASRTPPHVETGRHVQCAQRRFAESPQTSTNQSFLHIKSIHRFERSPSFHRLPQPSVHIQESRTTNMETENKNSVSRPPPLLQASTSSIRPPPRRPRTPLGPSYVFLLPATPLYLTSPPPTFSWPRSLPRRRRQVREPSPSSIVNVRSRWRTTLERRRRERRRSHFTFLVVAGRSALGPGFMTDSDVGRTRWPHGLTLSWGAARTTGLGVDRWRDTAGGGKGRGGGG